MKLGEARTRLERVCGRLKELRGEVPAISPEDVHGALIECSDLLQTRVALTRHIAETELATNIGGETLANIAVIQVFITDEIYFLAAAVARGDLSDTMKHLLYEKLRQLRTTRDNLERRIEKCVVETELISSS